MNFKAIKNNLKEIKYMKSLLKKYKSLLSSGRYYLFPSMRSIVLNDEDTLNIAKKYFSKNIKSSKTTWLISKINKTRYFFVKRRKNTLESYDAVYSANNSDKLREVKLFSFKRKEILTFCISKKECEKQILEYEKLHKYFKMPCVEKNLMFDNAYKISMVDMLSRPSETKALETITDSYIKFNEKNNTTKKTVEIISFKYDNVEIDNVLTALVSNINKEVLNLEFPICLQHGDLSRDNLIYGQCKGEENFWWIDWEHAKERIFYYDLFFYILNTALYYADSSAFEKYINGECDDSLKRYFKAFNVKYESKYRKDYFLIFVIDFLKERVCENGNVIALKKYFDFINNLIY